MEKAGVDININKFLDLTARLTGKEMDVAKKAAVRQGANYLRRVTNKAYMDTPSYEETWCIWC